MLDNNLLNSNQAITTQIWQQLLRASVDKYHEWRSPVLVTNGLKNSDNENWPDARTVILRAVNENTKELVFYTDSRSPKVAQLVQNPKAMVVFWSKRLNWQLRIKATVKIDLNSDLVQKTWEKVKQSPSAGDYLRSQMPGEILNNAQNSSKQLFAGTAHFALVIAQVIEIDWLELSRNGHRRANIKGDDFNELVP